MKDFSLKVAVALSTVTFALAGIAGVASADSADPTNGAAEDLLSSVQTWVGAHGIPLLVALLVLGTIVTVLVKYAKKGRAQV